jgi:hypothetical protein
MESFLGFRSMYAGLVREKAHGWIHRVHGGGKAWEDIDSISFRAF